MVDGKKLRLFVERNGVCVAAVSLAILFYSGVVPICTRNPYLALLPAENVSALEGYICSNPVKTSNGKSYRCMFDLVSVRGFVDSPGGTCSGVCSQASGRVEVYVPASIVEAHYPGKLYSAAKMSISGDSALMLVENGARFSFDVRYLGENDRENSINMGSPPQFFVTRAVAHGFDDSISGKIAMIRGVSRLGFKRLLYTWGDAGGLLLALLSGSGEYTDRTLSESFRSAGLAHILALSGMHLSFFAGLAASATRVAGRRFSDLFSLVTVTLFVWFAGFTPSLLRAFISSLLCTATGFCGFKPGALRILAITFIVHVCIAPSDLSQISFQLSYAALAGILMGNSFFEPIFFRFFPPYIASGLTASAGAQTISAPITMSTFGCVMPGGMIATLVVSPLVSLFLTTGVVAILVSLLIPVLTEPLGGILNLLYTCVELPVRLFARIPALEL